MTTHEIEPLFRTACELAVRYRTGAPNRPPRAAAVDQEAYAGFAGPVPESGEAAITTLTALAAAAGPGLHDTTGDRFFGWIIGASHPVGVAADWLTSTWGQNPGLHFSGPAGAAAEKVAGDWLLDLLDLPREASVGFVTGATMANFTGLAAGRSEVLRRVGWDVEADGLQGAPRVRVLLGEAAHSTVFAALRYLGFGRNQIETVEADANGIMDADDLGRRLSAGGPALVVAQAGQINTGGFDPFEEIAAHCRRAGAWLHVDGAFGLWARACPDRYRLTRGLELADSWASDAHKWLQAPYESGFVIVRDRAVHRRAMSISASYLPSQDWCHNPADFSPELSRRARGFAIWALLKHLGRDGIADMVSRHCALARRIAARLARVPGIRVLNDVVLNQLVVTFGEGPHGDRMTREVIEEIQRRNAVFVEGARWQGREVVRISVISAPLNGTSADRLCEEILAAWQTVEARQTAAVPAQ